MSQESRLAVTIDSRGARRNAEDMAQSLTRMEQAGDAAAASTDQVTESLDDQRRELGRLLGQINPTVAALDRLDDQQQRLARFRRTGLVDSETFTEYTDRLNSARNALGETADGMNRTGMSARAMQANLRMLPAQFTDIAVSLQGGQAPLTVFLQQGGQIKDMFGGIGPAARAMGGYVLGLVNPFTVAAAAAGALALAYYQGSEESDRLTNSIIKNGNAAGTSFNELGSLAQQVANTGTTVGAAAEVLGQLAAAGNRLTPMYAQITQASLAWSKQTGTDVSEVVKSFNDIAKSPVEAIKKLDAELNFLTASQYANIISLQEQGKTMEAAQIAADLYANAISSRAGEMKENLGSLESAWQSLAGFAKQAWDAMLDVGRKQTPEQELAEVYKQISDAQKNIGQYGRAASSRLGINPDSLKALEKRATELQGKIALAGVEAWEAGTTKVIQDAGKKGVDLINSTYQSSLTQTEKLQKQLDDLQKGRLAAQKSGALSAEEEAKFAQSRKNIEQQIADIKEREAKKNAPKNVNKGVSEAETTFSRLYNQYDPAAQAARALTKEQTQLQLALDKGKISQEEYGKALAQSSINYAAAIKGAQGLTQAEQYRAQLEKQLSTQRSQYSLEAAGVGMGDQQSGRLQQRVQFEQQTNDRILQLRTELANATTEKQRQDLQAQIALEETYLPKRLAALENGFAQYDVAISSPMNGWNAALQNFQASAANVAGQTQAIFAGAFGNITTGVGSAFERMTLDGQSFGESAIQVTRSLVGGVINGLGQMAAQWAVNQALQLVFGKTQQVLAAEEMARVAAETAAKTTSIATVTTAKVTADGVMTASGLASTATSTAAQTAAAATTASAWLPAALVASIGSFGAAAVVGGTALLAAFALTRAFKDGGHVSGPGTGTSDSIPARLSNGEFVVNAQATKRNRELLEAINSNERVSFAGENISLSKSGAGSEQVSAGGVGGVVVNLIEDKSQKSGTVNSRVVDRQQVLDIVVSSIYGDEEVHDALSTKYGISGVGR
jgi:phage-related minor tail protein